MVSAVAIEIDDILNNFSDLLNDMGIIYNNRLHSIADPLLQRCLYDMKTGRLTQIAEQVMGSAVVRQDGVAFLRWLYENGWTIVLFTYRDLRYTQEITVKWLLDYRVPYDYLFYVDNLLSFCRDMNIKYMFCNRPYRCEDLLCFFPAVSEKRTLIDGAYEFRDFEEVKRCIQK